MASDIRQITSDDVAAATTIAREDDFLLPLIGWITYLVGFSPIGVVIAYLDRPNVGSPARENYIYMIRTFWIGLVTTLLPAAVWAGAVAHRSLTVLQLAPVLVPTALFACLGVAWFWVRCIKGLVFLVRRVPIRNPQTWLV